MKDLTGQVFGELTVVGFSHKTDRSHWNCRCKCGKTIVVAGTALTSGNTKACRHMKDLTGQRFGQLTVTGFSHRPEKKDSFWHCLCDCGNTTIVSASNLKTGGTKSCGHQIDLTGQVFGRFTVLEFSHRKGRSYWKCSCECGNVITVRDNNLKGGNTQSCGCLQRESATTHGLSDSASYPTWCDMIRRCTDTKCKDYKYYGGRGIKVCDRWLKFENFLADVGERPEGATLDRKDNNGNYSPDNWHWATRTEQMRNYSKNRMIYYEGRTQCLSAWTEELGLNYNTVRFRLNRDWTVEEAFTIGVK